MKSVYPGSYIRGNANRHRDAIDDLHYGVQVLSLFHLTILSSGIYSGASDISLE